MPIPTTSPDYSTTLAAAINAKSTVQVAAGSTDAITVKEGLVVVTSSGVDAMTLANPTAGAVSAGGDDGKTLTIVSSGAHAHTITTGALGLNGAHTIGTFAASIGSAVELKAYNGSWYMVNDIGCTLSA